MRVKWHCVGLKLLDFSSLLASKARDFLIFFSDSALNIMLTIFHQPTFSDIFCILGLFYLITVKYKVTRITEWILKLLFRIPYVTSSIALVRASHMTEHYNDAQGKIFLFQRDSTSNVTLGKDVYSYYRQGNT